MDYHQFDDETLMRLITQAQDNALGELYDRYGRLVYSMAFRATSDAAIAEEITQDVFLRVWDKASTYQPSHGKVITWIASITRYRAIDMLRRQKVRPEGNQSFWSEEPNLDLPDKQDVEAEVETSDQNRRLREAVQQLPPDQRHALGLAFFQGYSHSEIASILGEPLGTVKTRIRLAMQKLRSILGNSP